MRAPRRSGAMREARAKAETMSMSPLSAARARPPAARARGVVVVRRQLDHLHVGRSLSRTECRGGGGSRVGLRDLALSEKELFKIEVGFRQRKIPGSVSVFRCPRCAAKLRKPPGVFADSASSPKIKNRKDGKEEKRETTQKRSAFDEELASLRAAREALERHVAFSKSLEGVVGAATADRTRSTRGVTRRRRRRRGGGL